MGFASALAWSEVSRLVTAPQDTAVSEPPGFARYSSAQANEPIRQGGLRLTAAREEGCPLLSIVTVVRNGAATLERTIASVLAQEGEREYLIIDGGSTDGTVEILQRYADRIDYWVSEPDGGIADAFNRGVVAARGRYIGLINADDWYEPGALTAVAQALAHGDADIVYGWLQCWRDGEPDFLVGGDHERLDTGMTIAHPASFVRRALYEQVGLFNTDLRYAMDYEFMLRARAAGARFQRIDRVLAHLTQGGLGDRHWRDSLAEVAKVRTRYVARAGGAWRWRVYYAQHLLRAAGRRVADRLGLRGLRRLWNRWVSPAPVIDLRHKPEHKRSGPGSA